jgi:hypothetical protein
MNESKFPFKLNHESAFLAALYVTSDTLKVEQVKEIPLPQ